MNNSKTIIVLLLSILLSACSDNPVVEPSVVDPYADEEFMVYSSFDSSYNTMSFYTGGSDDISYEVVANPLRSGINTTRRCAKVVSGSGEYEFVYSEPYGRKFDFTKNKPVFRMKVLAPKVGAKVYFKLEPTNLTGDNQPVEIQNVVTSKTEEWEELIFDFTDFEPESNVYRKLVIVFDAGVKSVGDEWYFDEIYGPSDDLTGICLFKRYEGNPVFKPEGNNNWRDSHIANAGIISPADSPDGEWWMYVRGSGHTPEAHDQIGLFKQPAEGFKPFGSWNEYKGNPVLKFGARGSYDELNLLDCCPVVGKDGVFYVYYKARDYNDASSIGCGYSADGYNFTKLPEAWRTNSGPCDAVYFGGKYYIFAGTQVFVTDDPLDSSNAEIHQTIKVGGGPSNFDSLILWGTMVFRLKDVDKWFMAYQASAVHGDFPDRFHIAVSDDLLNWTKIDNRQPLFTRGSVGEWDQGGIWFPEIIEYDDMLYLYYEGWGREGFVDDRNKPYFLGCSCIGVASVSKSEFLEWCGL